MDFSKFINRKVNMGEMHKDHDKVFNITFGITKDYTAQVGVLMTTIIANNKDMIFHFHIFCDDVSDCDVKKFEQLVNMNENMAITIYYINNAALNHLKTSYLASIAMFYRIIGAAFLYPKIKKMLYLDADIMCIGELQELKKLDFEDVCLASHDSGSWIPKHNQELGLPIKHKYFNSGVLYINLQKWNEKNISERAMDLLTKNIFSFPDQDALNIVIRDNYSLLSQKYNQFYMNEGRKEVDLPSDAVFLHFAGDVKPWHPWCSSSHKMLWKKALRESLWSEYVYLPRNYRENKYMSRFLYKQGEYGAAIGWYWRYVVDKIKFKTK